MLGRQTENPKLGAVSLHQLRSFRGRLELNSSDMFANSQPVRVLSVEIFNPVNEVFVSTLNTQPH